MRFTNAVVLKVVASIDTCWPTAGLEPGVEGEQELLEVCRFVGEVQVLEDRRRHEVLNTVETEPSCRKPKPRTWSPTVAPPATPNMPTFW